MIKIKGKIGLQSEDSENVFLVDLAASIMKEKSTDIEIEIDSVGGDLIEALRMYKYIRDCTTRNENKLNITTRCVNNCCSAASLIFLAGDKRIAMCPIMIHNPYVLPEAIGVRPDAAGLKSLANNLLEYEKLITDIYTETTKADKQLIKELLKYDTYITPDNAAAYGFATESNLKIVATLNNSNNMDLDFLKGLKKFMSGKGYIDIPKQNVIMMTLETADGRKLEFMRQDGKIEVGDHVSAEDGEYTMPDGSIIMVETNKITEIKESGKQVIKNDVNIQDVDIESLPAVVALRKENAELEDNIKKCSQVILDYERLNNKINLAGGEAKVFSMFKNDYTPQLRASPAKFNAEDEIDLNYILDRVAKNKK